MDAEQRYLSAVKGRQDFRAAYRREREQNQVLRAMIEECLEAMNPKDLGGISLHIWNQRMKEATANAKALLEGE